MTRKTLEKLTICPGETHPISRSVHLARLASFYPRCRDCPLRSETGQLPSNTVKRLQSTERRVERKSLFTAEGVRGVYLNELTRARAGHMAAVLASLLWEESPLGGGSDAGRRGHVRTRPAVVVGHDERPSSPDVVTGVVTSLRRMGCQVIDVGLVTRPCFWFAVDHLQASAGIHVTGAGCEPSWTGLDFVGRSGLPLSKGLASTGTETHRSLGFAKSQGSEIDLDRLEDRLAQPYSRPTRRAGQKRTFGASIPYEAGLWKHFHALRPLRVCFGSSSRLVRRTLERIFEKLPCQLIPVEIPHRARNLSDPDDPDVARLSAAVCRSHAHLGVLIDDGGDDCSFFDEEGTCITAGDITRLIAELLLAEHPEGAIVLETSAGGPLRSVIEAGGGKCVDGGCTLSTMSQTMRMPGAVFGGGNSGRYWFRESLATCDAVLAVAKVLEALSRSDTRFSEAIGPHRGSDVVAINGFDGTASDDKSSVWVSRNNPG